MDKKKVNSELNVLQFELEEALAEFKMGMLSKEVIENVLSDLINKVKVLREDVMK